MEVPRELRYTKTHEWVRVDGKIATIGITDFAQEQLSGLTFVELPEVGDQIEAEDEVGVVESVKAASDVYAPVSGKVVAVNKSLADNPEVVNTDPYGEGWLFKVRMSNPKEVEALLDADEYEESLPEPSDEG